MRKIFGLKRKKVTRNWRKFIILPLNKYVKLINLKTVIWV